MTSSLFSLFTIIFSISNLYFNVKHAAKIQTYFESTKLFQIFFLSIIKTVDLFYLTRPLLLGFFYL